MSVRVPKEKKRKEKSCFKLMFVVTYVAEGQMAIDATCLMVYYKAPAVFLALLIN